MREARIICASEQRDNRPVALSVISQLEETLAQRFGGYTVVMGRGGYVMDSGELKTELVRVYDVAMEAHHFPALTGIAQWLCREANQECVYVRDPTGQVSFYNRGLEPAQQHVREIPADYHATQDHVRGDYR